MSTPGLLHVAILISAINLAGVSSRAAEREPHWIEVQGRTLTGGFGPEIVPELGISVNNSPSSSPKGLLVCFGWMDDKGNTDGRTGLSVGDLILRLNGQATSDPKTFQASVKRACEQGKPLVLAVKKRLGDPFPPDDFMTPQSRMAADAFQYEQKFLRQEIVAAVAKELAEKSLAQQAAATAALQAANEAKKYTAKDGRVITAAEIINHNKRVDAAMQAGARGMDGFDAERLAAAQSNVLWVVQHVQSGDREKLRRFMLKLSNLSPPARRDIDSFLQQTPAGTYLVGCNNGDAVTWMDAYAQGLGALIEVQMGLPAK